MGQAKQKKDAENAAREAFLEQHVVLKRRQIEPILNFLLEQGPMREVAPLFNTLQRAQAVNYVPAPTPELARQDGEQVKPEEAPEDIKAMLEEEKKQPKLHVPGE